MFNYNPYLKELLEYIKQYGELPKDNAIDFNQICMELYNNRDNLDTIQIESLDYVLKICNIIYENTDFVMIDDDFYDVLVEVYRKYDKDFQIGAENIEFKPKRTMLHYKNKIDSDKKHMLKYVNLPKDDMLFYYDLTAQPKIQKEDCLPQNYENTDNISKRKIDTEQAYPELVGTLDKCKFVLNKQAIDKGVFNEDNVKVFERDFLGKHLQEGIIEQDDEIELIAELKYDGVSISAEIINGNTILTAQTRGDVKENVSADLTPIFKGFVFHHAPHDETVPVFGMKFEAIMTRHNLYKYNQMKGKSYANCRTAIIGLLGSSDAHLYRDLITLIPLQVSGSEEIPRDMQLKFLNDYYRNPEINRYSVISGNYISVLFQVKKFVEEAELMRDYIPYMYDGVVISYNDPYTRNLLGRENSVNKYSMAIKFSPLKKQTKFLGYTFTVGQDGTITPMIHFAPVMFFGTIHDKASGHSYARFKELGLRTNDIIDVEYTNDVMAYVTKPDNSYNEQNSHINALCGFPSYCPSCGTKLEISQSGKNAKCPNLDCKERNIARVNSMFKKLNIKDFSDAYISKIGKYHLKDMFALTKEDVSFLGEINSQKFIDSMNELKTKDIYDYRIIGALGFTNVATEKWKTILKNYDIYEIMLTLMEENGEERLKDMIVGIKGIGPETANTIVTELPFFMDDIALISVMDNVIPIKVIISKLNIKKIRFTGCRDSELIEFLSSKGHDITGGSLTKDTDILLIPYEGYESSKTKKAESNGSKTIIVSIDEFRNNMEFYLK